MQLGFSDLDNRYAQLSKLNDPLEELNRIIDWNLFADLLAETTTKPRKSAAGRKPFVYADSACRSNAQEESLIASKHTSQIHEKGARNHPLTEAQKSGNKEKSRARVPARVEHVSGSMTNELGGITIRTIDHGRAKVQIGSLNLVYNIKRVVTRYGKDISVSVGLLRPKWPEGDKTRE